MTDQLKTPEVQVKLIDGAAIVNMLKPIPNSTFEEYMTGVFTTYINNQLKDVVRLDLIWDRYLYDSLKGTTREKRGRGVRRRVSATTKVPSNWQEFLRIDENKIELFRYIAEEITEKFTEKVVISTVEATVVCNQTEEDLTLLSNCNHEEADSRIFVHAKDISQKGHRKIMIRTVDTDVVVLAVSAMNQLELEEMWILFGVGKKTRFIPIHELCTTLGPSKCMVLPLFHTITGCDQSSSFAGRSKKTAWAVWNIYEELTESLQSVCHCPSEEQVQSIMPTLERFVILMYDRGSSSVSVNDARKELFTKKGRTIESIPPTQNALYLHVKRAIYQGAYVWGQLQLPFLTLPSPADWGWQKGVDYMWEPVWTTLPSASKACQELVKCGCNPEKGCRKRCKCLKSSLPCTGLCQCGGDCDID